MPPLVILTSVHGGRDGDKLVLDKKALEGLYLYKQYWPGPVVWMLSLRETPPSYSTPVDPASLPFDVVEVAEDRSDVPGKLPAGALLLASADNHFDLDLAAALPGQVVYIIEYTFKTRIDILRVADLPIHRKLRGYLWERGTERRRRKGIAAGIGLQSNGLPAHRAYGHLVPHAEVYFDTRLSTALQIDEAGLAAKQAEMRAGGPLRLAFSGRLDRMKGVHHLLPLMQALKAKGVDFTFDIFGDGALAAELKSAGGDLAGHIRFNGAVPFEDTLVPAMKSRIDLFVCPHPQGDPSCTYMETLGCGVPIAGFANEAWASMAQGQDFGVVVPVGDVEGLAREIAALAADRDRLADMAGAAARFGWAQPFERAFEIRVQHLKSCAAAGSGLALAAE